LFNITPNTSTSLHSSNSSKSRTSLGYGPYSSSTPLETKPTTHIQPEDISLPLLTLLNAYYHIMLPNTNSIKLTPLLLLTLHYMLLMLCGAIESNPGPPSSYPEIEAFIGLDQQRAMVLLESARQKILALNITRLRNRRIHFQNLVSELQQTLPIPPNHRTRPHPTTQSS
jgi:hypothetical protein